MPDVEQIKLNILRDCHDSPSTGHQGVARTTNLVMRQYRWTGLREYVKDYVGTCDQCTRSKNRNHKPFGLLRPLPIPKTP